MEDFTDVPDPIEADYSLWTPNTIVELHNVPWNNDYRDIVDWGTAAKRKAWFDNRPSGGVTKITGMRYARISEPIMLEIPFNQAYQYNYIRVINGPQIPTVQAAAEYFYFITAIAQPAPGVTMIAVQLDVWTTFGPSATFGKAYVERGHIGIANQNNFANFGRDFLTVPEGMDVGNEYQVVHHVNRDVMHKQDREHNDFTTHLLIATTVNLESDPGTVDNPKLATATGDNLQGLPSGAQYYAFTLDQFRVFMQEMKNKPWITQGIISITAVPELYRYGATLTPVTVPGVSSRVAVNRVDLPSGRGTMYNLLENWRDRDELLNMIPEKYRGLRKFFTFPYMALEMTNFTGSPLILKPELWNDPHAWTSEKAVLAAPNQRIMHWPVKYNAGRGSTIVDRNGTTVFDDNGEYLNANVCTTSLPTMAIVNNGYLAFMASNAHGITQQFNQADWSQQKSMAGNQLSYDQANNSIQTGASNALVGRNQAINQSLQANDYAWQTMGVSAAQGIGNGIQGGPAGIATGTAQALFGVAGTALNNANRNAQTNINNSSAVAIQNNTQLSQQYLADTNKSLADWASRGDYAQSINALNAKLQDARLTQPTISGQQGGDAFNLIHGGIILSLRFKMLSYNAMCIIGDYWLRYGYAVNRFITISKLSVMTKFTYWKLSEVYLVNTKLPEFIKQAIRGIFEKGVTVWTDPADIGVIDIGDNDPLSGIVIPVDELPSITPPPPPELVPATDEEDLMYLARTTDNNNNSQYWVVGKEYLANNGLANLGVSLPLAVIGEDYRDCTDPLVWQRMLSMFNIPARYIDYVTFLNENPDGKWSKQEELAAANVLTQQAVDANATMLTEILQKLDNPDTPSDGTVA